jgi:thymidylate synthase
VDQLCTLSERKMLKTIVELNKRKRQEQESDSQEEVVKENQDKDDDYHEEYQYINLLKDILQHGSLETGRNGKTRSVFGSAMHFSLADGKIPILTTKKTAWKTCLKELLWFVKGETDNKILNNQKVHIWDGNSTEEYKRSVGLSHYIEGDLGPIYGYQWRYFNAPYSSCNEDYTGNGVDQLQNVIDCLKDPERRNSRRLVVSAWNPCQIDKGVLPPCHVLFQFNVTDGNKLSCSLYQRSVDTALGQPFNIASYSFLTHLIAKHCGLIAHEFVYYMGNCHIYEEHLENMREQVKRNPYPFPTVEITNVRENINSYDISDFVVSGYQHHNPIKMNMVA